MKPTTQTALAVAALLVVGFAYFALTPTRQPELDREDDPAAVVPKFEKPPPPKVITAKLPAPKAVASPTSTERMFRLPDGSFLPALNGVKSDGARLKWGAGPFSPVDYTFADQDGLEWYRLKNGDFLTTVAAPGTVGDPPREITRNLFVRYQKSKTLPVADQLKIDPKAK